MIIEVSLRDQLRFGVQYFIKSGGLGITDTGTTVLSAVGAPPDFDVRHVKVLEGVKDVFRVTSPYKLAARVWHPENSVVDVDGVRAGKAVYLQKPMARNSRECREILEAADHLPCRDAELNMPPLPGARSWLANRFGMISKTTPKLLSALPK